MTVSRISSRSVSLSSLLTERLRRARTYDRIAGYFRSSLLEIAGEAIESVDEVRVVCNAELDPHDVAVAKAARSSSLAQALLSKWQAGGEDLDVLLHRDRHRRLYQLLTSGRIKVRVLSSEASAFLHGKAGVLTFRDGSPSIAFVGSVNESKTAWADNYEIIWEDDDPAACAWVREEFDWFWQRGVDLPDAVVERIAVLANRTQYPSIADWQNAGAKGGADAAAVLSNRPLNLAGEILRPWQKRFVQACLDDNRMHGMARLLIADDVGLGKTLSLASAMLVLALETDMPVLILAPSTLTRQWQVELLDKLGIRAALWSTNRKCWLEPSDRQHQISGRGADQIARCPMRIGIVSTGLIINGDPQGERAILERTAFGVLILDEVHKARVKRLPNGEKEGPNRLMRFMRIAAARSRHVLIGSATPIQLRVAELWDLMDMLSQGAHHVLGNRNCPNQWADDEVMGYLTGERTLPVNPVARWEILKNPLPPASEDPFFRDVRHGANLDDGSIMGPRFDSLGPDARDAIVHDFEGLFFRTNPIIRHTIRRSRRMLEDRGLLKRIGVDVHPQAEDLPTGMMAGEGLRMSLSFATAYEAARAFCEHYARNRPGAGFMRTILLRRVGSSVHAGLRTVDGLLAKDGGPIEDDEAEDEQANLAEWPGYSPEERRLLTEVRSNLMSVLAAGDPDPKARTIVHYLRDHDWLAKGCIIFSQYFDTVDWIATQILAAFPNEPVAIYAGSGRSQIRRGTFVQKAERTAIQDAVKNRQIRLMVATDAACEGLNLQTLGMQINVDLPWNPSKLEQRKGRVQRIGQVLDRIGVMNLRYAGTVEDEVYEALSQRFQGIFHVLGQLPDSFEDDWVDAVLTKRESLKHFASRTSLVRTPMEARYFRDISDDRGLDWESCTKVVSDMDVDEWMSRGWRS